MHDTLHSHTILHRPLYLFKEFMMSALVTSLHDEISLVELQPSLA